MRTIFVKNFFLVLSFFLLEGTTSVLAQPQKPYLNYPTSWSPVITYLEADYINADYLEFELDTLNTFTNPIWKGSDTVAKIWVNKNLNYGKTYFWRARQVDSSGKSDWSNIAKFKVLDTITGHFEINVGLSQIPTNYLEFWTYGSDRKKNEGSFVQMQIDTVVSFNSGSLKNSYTKNKGEELLSFYHLRMGKTYYIRTRGFYETDTSKWSSPQPYKVISSYPLAHKNFICMDINPRIEIKRFVGYKIQDSLTKYTIQISSDKSFTNIIGVYTIPDTFNIKPGNIDAIFQDKFTPYQFNNRYSFRFKVSTPFDTTAWSASDTFVTCYLQGSYYHKPSLENTNYTTDSLVFLSVENPGVIRTEIELDTVALFNSPFYKNYIRPRSLAYFDAKKNTYVDSFRTSFPLFYNTKYHLRFKLFTNFDTSDYYTSYFITNDGPKTEFPLAGTMRSPLEQMLQWNAIDNEAIHEIQTDTSSNFTSPALTTLQSDTIAGQAFAKDLFYGTKHFWRVRTRNAIDTSSWQTSNFTTADTFTARFPSNGSKKLDASSIFLLATAPVGTAYCELMLSADSSFASFITDTAAANNKGKFSKYILPNAIKWSSKYYWKVRAIHAKDTSSWSVIYSFTTGKQVPNTIQLIAPLDKQNDLRGDINFSWEKDSFAKSYVLRIANSETFSGSINKTYFPDSSFITIKDKDLPAGQIYYWTVYGIGEDFSGAPAPLRSFKKEYPLSIDNQNTSNFFSVYPNPASETVTISALGNNDILSIELMDINGKKIQNYSGELSQNINLDVRNIVNGIYYLRISGSRFSSSVKLILVK